MILTVVTVGVLGVVYNKTLETTEFKTSPAPTPRSEDIAADQTGRLSDKPIELNVDDSVTSSPKFSIIPPAGWQRLASNGNILIDFLAPSKDKITEGLVILDLQPNITVFVAKENFKNLDEAVEFVSNQNTDSFYQVNNKKKTKINGQDAYVIESTIDIASNARLSMESQFNQEIAKSGQQISEEAFRKDMEKVLQQAKAKVISYAFYKNGYYINVAGKALVSFWDKRGSQLKRSMDTFKFE